MPGLDLLYDLLKQMAEVIPNLVGALVLLLVGYLIAKIVAKIIRKILEKVGVNKIGEKLNEIDLIQKSNFNFSISGFLSKVIYYLLLLIFVVAATDVLGMEAISNLMTDIINYVPQLITALVLLIIGLLLSDVMKSTVKTTCTSLGIPSAGMIAGFAFWFVFLTVGVSALGQAGIDTQFIMSNLSIILAGGVFAFALGYGIASKEIVANFLSSFYNKNKVSIGDTISLDGVKGEIVEMDNSSITILSKTGRVIVPMSKLSTENVEIIDK